MSKLRQLKMIWQSLMLETDDKTIINNVLIRSAWELVKQTYREFVRDWQYLFNKHDTWD